MIQSFIRRLFSKDRVFLDACSGLPESRISQKARSLAENSWGNPSSPHLEGRSAKEILESARNSIAKTLGVRSSEIIFTSGGTESANLAISGVAKAQSELGNKPHIVLSAGEHPALIESARQSKKESNAELTFISVDNKEISEKKEFSNATIAIASRVNGESGAITSTRKLHQALPRDSVLIIDASQAALIENVSPHRLAADLLILDASKIGGPRGIGCLVVSGAIEILPLIVGGGQERGLRAGSESPALAAGFAAALAEVQTEAESTAKNLKLLSLDLWREITKIFPEAKMNVSESESAPHILSVFFPNLDAAYATTILDTKGIAVAASSACRAAANEVAAAFPEDIAKSSIRFSFPPTASKKDVERALFELPHAIHLAIKHDNPWQ